MDKPIFRLIRQRFFLIVIMILLSISLLRFFATLFGEQKLFASSSYYYLILIILLLIIFLLVVSAVIVNIQTEFVQTILSILQWLQTFVLIGTFIAVIIGLNYLKTPTRNVPYIPPGSVALCASGAYVRYEKLTIQIFDDDLQISNITKDGYIYKNVLYDSTCWTVCSIEDTKDGKAVFVPDYSTIHVSNAVCNLSLHKKDFPKWKNVRVSALITIDSLIPGSNHETHDPYGSAGICLRSHLNSLGYTFQIGPKFNQIWIMPLNFKTVGKDFYERKKSIKIGIRYQVIAQVYNGQLRLFVCDEHERLLEHEHLLLETYFEDSEKE